MCSKTLSVPVNPQLYPLHIENAVYFSVSVVIWLRGTGPIEQATCFLLSLPMMINGMIFKIKLLMAIVHCYIDVNAKQQHLVNEYNRRLRIQKFCMSNSFFLQQTTISSTTSTQTSCSIPAHCHRFRH